MKTLRDSNFAATAAQSYGKKHSKVLQLLNLKEVQKQNTGISKGDLEEGLRNINDAIDRRMSTARQGIYIHVYTLATIHLLNKNFEKGLKAIETSLKLPEQTDDQCFLSEVHRIKGELLFGKNPQVHANEIEDCFKTSLFLARRYQAKSLELRSTMSMTRWLQSQGKKAEALSMISNICSWFTEGFETKDLLDAQALIEELSVSAPLN